MRELRRLLRYRQMVVAQAVRLQNKMAGLLTETGTPFVKAKLHGKKYFTHLLDSNHALPTAHHPEFVQGGNVSCSTW